MSGKYGKVGLQKFQYVNENSWCFTLEIGCDHEERIHS